VNAEESDDAVFEEEEDESNEEVIQATTRDDNEINGRAHKRHYGNRLTGRSISLSDDPQTNIRYEEEQSPRRILPSTSHPARTESPPNWIPDSAAPRCMSCESQFTAFRRRHHCR
jgi:lateral signaling target protein 2